MARSPAPSSPARRSQPAWLLILVLALAAFAIPVADIAHVNGPGAAVGYGALGLALLLALDRLRGRHRRAEAEAAELRGRLAELEAAAVGRESGWRSHVEQRLSRQADQVREEVEHLVKERLPAALAGAEIPAAPHAADGAGPALTEWFDRLLTEVAETVEHREESQRLAMVELASRVQTSAHRIQAAVTGLADRYPGDFDLLETTMQIDHAATQQARHAQSLKVLCGEWPGQQWQRPLAMVDVVRAASGRIVAYKRVEVTGDPDVGVAPSIVEPLIHLLAELLANATEYSPPRTGVPVTVRTVQRGAVIEVDDGGLGMDEYRLAEAREIASGNRLLGVGEVGEIPQTGFAVVGRFADRHGFQVDLGPSPYGGVRAVVLVPAAVLETLAPAGSAVRPPPVPPLPQVSRVPRPTAAPDGTDEADEADGTDGTGEAGGTDKANGAGTAAPAAPPSSAAPALPPASAVPPAAASAVPPAPDASAASPVAETVLPEPPRERTARRLPQRRSRRDAYAPAVEAAPSAVTPPGTPEQAGDWMEQFFEGGRSDQPPGSLPREGRQGPSSPTTEHRKD
ncbi:ATP-binding protein [Streptomyces corynorhini]|uniref:ATP-binding protein n=1 Tax=Streptomyces corynorhini TaxID=2282652 RepID=UPI0018F59788|nr:sensor histidine kinase [Streptomyces corynorhini]